jgi:hypothetical protein
MKVRVASRSEMPTWCGESLVVKAARAHRVDDDQVIEVLEIPEQLLRGGAAVDAAHVLGEGVALLEFGDDVHATPSSVISMFPTPSTTTWSVSTSVVMAEAYSALAATMGAS